MEKDSKKKSKYLEQYFDFVGKEGQPIQDPSHEVLKRYRAEISSADALARRRRRFDLRLIYTSKNASTVYYIVDLGRFRMTISILNLQGKSPTAIGGTKMGSGSFGTVLVKNVANTEFVAKIIVLQRKTPDELEEIVLEVAISKLCAMFGISPDVETSIPYDLIVYEDAAQFHLEKCKTLCNWGEQFTAKTKGEKNIVIANLIDCLRVLHSLHIAHRDIKPSNALYCQRLNRYVICDFGVARYVYEAIGQTSRTNCCGSRRFMGPEMAELYDNKKSQIRVDLYYNDVVACEQLVRILYEPTRWMEEGSDKSFRKVEDDSFPQAYSESSQENRKISKKQPPLEPEPPKILPAFQKPDSYEFYRIHYAATAFGEHEFNLKENLHRLTEEQQAYIHGILGQSLNRSKMEQVLRQLWDLKPEVGTLQKKWLDDFVAAYRKNFDRHQPLFAQMPPLSREWVNNLTRLLGKNQQLRMIQQLDEEGLSQLDEQQLQEVYQAIVYEIKKKRWKRLYDQIFFLKASEQQDITIAWATVVQGLFSYDTKESMINDLFKSIQDNTISDQRLLHCLAAIVKKDSKASDLLYQFVQTEQPLERCLMLCSIHYNTSMDKSVKMLAVCSQLLERLGKLPVQCWFLETINVLHTQFRVKESRRELNHHDVRAHFEKSLRLLARHSSHQDAGSIHFILAEQLLYFQQFQFTQQDIRDTHIEFEQCRQFYSGMEKIDMDRQVMDTYIQQPMWAPQNMTTRNQRDYQRVQLQHQLELLKDQGRLREALEFQRKKTALMRHQLLQDGFDGDAPHILSGVIHEAIILSNIGRPQQAYDLLLSIDDRVASSSMLRIHEYYYFAKANASNWLGRHHEALNCCEKAISFNNELSPSSTQQTQAYKLRELQAKIYGCLGQYENSLKVLSELRGMLLANGRPHSYRNLAENYSSAAEVYRGMKRFHDGTAFCQKVFQLEQRGLIFPHVSAFAHSVVAKIYEQQRQVNKSLEECWNFLERTNALGNENFCIMYTLILRSCEEAVGSEALSFISYARKFTDPPRQTLRGNYIAEELYLSPVPTGLLPLDMPTAEFLKLAESSLRTLSVPQHFCCSQFKKQLLRVMPGKFRQLPQFRLIYVQTLAEIALHNSIGWEGKDLLKQLDYVVEQMLECEVAEIDQDSKQLLVECILERSDAVKNAMAVQKMLPACPASYKRRADAKRAH